MVSLNDIKEFNSELFHFERPDWLWLFVVLLALVIFIYYTNREKSKWKSIIAEPLQKFMFTNASKRSQLYPIISLVLACSFAILAIAGPAWKRVDIPGMKSTKVMMILMDLSWSMTAEDIQPNRLERAKLKIHDLMAENPRVRTSLFVYAGTLHPVMTLTSDYKIINHHVDNLEAKIMPVRGDDLNLAMGIADSVFERFTAPSTLLLVTDEVEADEVAGLLDFVNNSPHSIEILVMSSSAGAPVPGFRRNTMLKDANGNQVISKADPAIWSQLGDHEKIFINQLTLDKSDVEEMAKRLKKDLVFQLEDEESEEEWQDEGLLFLIPTLLFGLMFFRKGYMIQWCIVIVAFGSCSPDAKLADLWYTPDYKGQKLEEMGRYEEAAASYEDTQHKAVAYYKAGDYEAAAELFAQDSSAESLYNYGLTMVQLGNYDEAKYAFERALEEDPDFSAAQASVKQVDRAIREVDSLNALNPQQAIAEKTKGPLREREAQSEDEELSSDTEVDELPKGGDRITDEVESGISQAEELERPPENMDQSGLAEAQNVLLRTISAEPSEFLRRRFRFQREKYYPDIREGEKKW